MKTKKSLSAFGRGFTLLEILIVIAVVGILAAVILISLSSARESARNKEVLSQIKSLSDAVSACILIPGNSGLINLDVSGLPIPNQPICANSQQSLWPTLKSPWVFTDLLQDNINGYYLIKISDGGSKYIECYYCPWTWGYFLGYMECYNQLQYRCDSNI